MNEKNDNVNCLKEEPLITADQVSVFKLNFILSMSCFDHEKKKQNATHISAFICHFSKIIPFFFNKNIVCWNYHTESFFLEI